MKKHTKYYLAVLYFIICGLIPFYSIHNEFTTHGQEIARIYSCLFYFPLFIGFLLPLFIVPPTTFAFKMLSNRNKVSFILIVLFITTASTVSDIYVGNTAIWEVAPEYHETTISKSSKTDIIGHVIKVNKKNPKEIKQFEKTLWRLAADSKKSSKTKYFCFISIFIQALFFPLIFLVPGILFVKIKECYLSKEKFRKSIFAIVIACLLLFFWFLTNLSLNVEIARIYSSQRLSISTFIILIILLSSLIFCIGTLWLTFREQIKSIFTLLTTLGLTFTTVNGIISPESISSIFGRNAYWPNYLAILAFVLLLAFILFLPKNLKEKQLEIEFPLKQ